MTSGGGSNANIEIKAKLTDFERGVRVATGLAARDLGERHQVDTYFRVPRGRLKLRRSSDSGDEIILYVRPDEPGPRRCDYAVIAAPPGSRAKELLEGMFDADVVVEKVRRLFLHGKTRIHLDRVKGLGEFLEFEAVYPCGDEAAERSAREDVDRLLLAFDVRREHLVSVSYRDLLLRR